MATTAWRSSELPPRRDLTWHGTVPKFGSAPGVHASREKGSERLWRDHHGISFSASSPSPAESLSRVDPVAPPVDHLDGSLGTIVIDGDRYDGLVPSLISGKQLQKRAAASSPTDCRPRPRRDLLWKAESGIRFSTPPPQAPATQCPSSASAASATPDSDSSPVEGDTRPPESKLRATSGPPNPCHGLLWNVERGIRFSPPGGPLERAHRRQLSTSTPLAYGDPFGFDQDIDESTNRRTFIPRPAVAHPKQLQRPEPTPKVTKKGLAKSPTSDVKESAQSAPITWDPVTPVTASPDAGPSSAPAQERASPATAFKSKQPRLRRAKEPRYRRKPFFMTSGMLRLAKVGGPLRSYNARSRSESAALWRPSIPSREGLALVSSPVRSEDVPWASLEGTIEDDGEMSQGGALADSPDELFEDEVEEEEGKAEVLDPDTLAIDPWLLATSNWNSHGRRVSLALLTGLDALLRHLRDRQEREKQDLSTFIFPLSFLISELRLEKRMLRHSLHHVRSHYRKRRLKEGMDRVKLSAPKQLLWRLYVENEDLSERLRVFEDNTDEIFVNLQQLADLLARSPASSSFECAMIRRMAFKLVNDAAIPDGGHLSRETRLRFILSKLSKSYRHGLPVFLTLKVTWLPSTDFWQNSVLSTLPLLRRKRGKLDAGRRTTREQALQAFLAAWASRNYRLRAVMRGVYRTAGEITIRRLFPNARTFEDLFSTDPDPTIFKMMQERQAAREERDRLDEAERQRNAAVRRQEDEARRRQMEEDEVRQRKAEAMKALPTLSFRMRTPSPMEAQSASEGHVTVGVPAALAKDSPLVRKEVGQGQPKLREGQTSREAPPSTLKVASPEALPPSPINGACATLWHYNLYSNDANEGVEVKYIKTKQEAEQVAGELIADASQSERSPYVLGFDMEWSSHARTTDGPKKNVSLIQLADERTVYLFHISRFSKEDKASELMPTNLKRLLEEKSIRKVGVNIKGDRTRLRNHFEFLPSGYFELSRLYHLVAAKGEAGSKKVVNLARQVEERLGLPLSKDEVRISDWTRELTKAQRDYAANDAYAGFHLYHEMWRRGVELETVPPLPMDIDLEPRPRYEKSDGPVGGAQPRDRKKTPTLQTTSTSETTETLVRFQVSRSRSTSPPGRDRSLRRTSKHSENDRSRHRY